MKHFFREFGKVVTLIILWGFPILLLWMTQNTDYLWFYFLSSLFTLGTFSHYEDLNKTDHE